MSETQDDYDEKTQPPEHDEDEGEEGEEKPGENTMSAFITLEDYNDDNEDWQIEKMKKN